MLGRFGGGFGEVFRRVLGGVWVALLRPCLEDCGTMLGCF